MNNIEKFVNSKFYRGFEWFYRLIFLNLLILIISFSFASIPFFIWYLNQELGFLIYIALILFAVLFIPAFITSMFVIKHYADDNTGNFFVVYFKYFIETIKSIYLVELILVPIFLIILYGFFHYWQLLGPEYYHPDAFGIFTIIACAISFFFVIFFFFMFINLSLLVCYFRMKTKDYIVMTFKFSMKFMFQSLLAVLVLFIPLVLLFLIKMDFVPIYFILGISLPEYLIYLGNRSKFNFLQRNIDEINKI